ncbi:ABC transporter substrate-binding protein [Kribbella solani]|uniref:Thiamine pyrimidine synthase n=1 Tax=Kribbella solani TaxID=236067 RepID=A0A841DPW7_9ACTN|nr:ABC transporter substrate-binding protein [Kribbella solani]MBB5978806.1 NitT/TauT family transport system substrate-binding protein [Kribbella solani]MDX2971812.1 ABC transporter substrate-binding protein [Kribbella solani]MDX3000474.1 ABC transporter substrate-binding protein [Kribbella solani]
MRLRRSVIALMAVLGLAAVSACNGGSKDKSADDGGLQKVSYLTSFNTFGREAYAYVALEKGYFKDAGFDVKISPGTGTVDVMKLVAGGQADYGIGDFTATAITLGKQKLPVTTVGMIHQKSLAAIMSLEGLGIKGPQDLPGKTIGDQPGSTNTVMFPVYANAVHIDPKSVTFLPSPPPALPNLLAAGKVQGIGQFVVGQPLIEKADPKHRKAVTLPYGDVLPDLYGNAIITRTDLAKDHPDQVKKFTAALLKGLQDTIDDPAGAAETLKKYVPTTDVAVATAELNIMKDYVKPKSFNGPLGDVSVERVQKIIALLEQSKAITPGAIKPEDVVTMSLAPKS